MNKEVEIEVSYVGDQPLISILESNLDLEKVSFRRNQYAVRSVLPINLILSINLIFPRNAATKPIVPILLFHCLTGCK